MSGNARKRRATTDLRQLMPSYDSDSGDDDEENEQPGSPADSSSGDEDRSRGSDRARRGSDSDSNSSSSTSSTSSTGSSSSTSSSSDSDQDDDGGDDGEEDNERDGEEENDQDQDEEDDDSEVDEDAEQQREGSDEEDEEEEEESRAGDEEDEDEEGGAEGRYHGLSSDAESSGDEGTEIQLRVFKERRQELMDQIHQLREGTLPDYVRRAKELEKLYQFEVDRSEEDYKRLLHLCKAEYEMEVRQTLEELEEKKAEAMEQLLNDLEDKKRLVEQERNAMDLHSDSLELKPMTTRKLRRRPNDPAPQCKKGGPRGPAQVKIALDDDAINADLAEIAPELVGVSTPSTGRRNQGRDSNTDSPRQPVPPSPDSAGSDTRIEDGKLFYEKRWYMRGQSVTATGRELGRVCGVISAINADSVCLRRLTHGNRVQIPLSHLQCGRVTLRRRNS